MPNGFDRTFIATIKADILANMQSQSQEIEREGTNQIQKAVKDLQVYDTGNLASRSNTKVFSFSDGLIIRGQTVDVEYAEHPFFGTGTSRDYGPRNWLALWAKIMVSILKLR